MTPEPTASDLAETFAASPVETDSTVVEDLIEELSIDGMCGVY